MYRLKPNGEPDTYRDGEPVPYPVYRCKKADTKPSKVLPFLSNDQHKCKRVTDHDGPCKCLCGKEFVLT